MSISVLVNGAQGRMGKITVETLKKDPELTLVAESSNAQDLIKQIKQTQPQIVVDFTNANSAYENALTIIEHNVHPVIGTSGLTTSQIHQLQALSKKKSLGGIIAPNFSVATILMMRFAKDAAKYLPDVEIIEAHHPDKLDAPSGTALKTAEMIAEGREEIPDQVRDDRLASLEAVPGSRGALHHNIPIHAIRLPGVIATQETLFGNTGEILSIKQTTFDRGAFMPGVVLACKQVLMLKELIYGLEHIL